MHRSLIRRVLAALGVAGLISVAAGGASVWSPPRLGRPDSLVLLGVLVLSGILGAAVVHFGPLRPTTRAGALPVFVVVLSTAGLFALSRLPLGVPPTLDERPDTVAGDGEGRRLLFQDDRDQPVRIGETPENAQPPVRPTGPPLVLILVFVLVGAATLMAWKRARKAGPEVGDPLEGVMDAEAVRRGILRSIDAMLADPNPDTAVIGAYARLLEGLAAAGAPRRDFEGPVEHLRRALSRLRVRPEPARTLVQLFEIARFSDRSLTAGDRDRALDALRNAFADLGGEVKGLPQASGPVAGPGGP